MECIEVVKVVTGDCKQVLQSSLKEAMNYSNSPAVKALTLLMATRAATRRAKNRDMLLLCW